MLPSRALINAVMSFVPDAIELNKYGKSLDLYELAYEDGSVIGGGNINIYELMHMMKEWAYDNGYFILSAIDGYSSVDDINDNWKQCFKLSIPPQLEELGNEKEFEAVTKACEWIFEQQNVSD